MSGAPSRILRAAGRTIEVGPGPALMGVVNATPDSFSDDGGLADVETLVGRGHALVAAGASWIDVGGETAAGGRPDVEAREEAERVVPVIERLAASGVLVSVDTHKAEVADAAIAAGAAMVNDVSGLRDLALADVCARTGAALVVMHTRARPKRTLLDPARYPDVVADVQAFLRERMDAAIARGVDVEQLVVDPGPDFAKTPAQTVAVLRRLGELHALGRPLLLAVSRKDFLGAITGRAPRDRGPATLAALGAGADAGAHLVRVHDVVAAADFLAVRSVLAGDRELEPEAGLTPDRYPPGTVEPGSWTPHG